MAVRPLAALVAGYVIFVTVTASLSYIEPPDMRILAPVLPLLLVLALRLLPSRNTL